MADELESFDFAKEIDELTGGTLVGSTTNEVSILGGEFEAGKITNFLSHWSFDEMLDRIWEYAHHLSFARMDLKTPALLERGLLFGSRGSLALRRDGGKFLWHFIGEPQNEIQTKLAAAGYAPRDFWIKNQDVRLRRSTERALLWGENKNGAGWQEDRVGWAELDYPIQGSASRVKIEYEVFTENGQVAFVWWKQLS